MEEAMKKDKEESGNMWRKLQFSKFKTTTSRVVNFYLLTSIAETKHTLVPRERRLGNATLGI